MKNFISALILGIAVTGVSVVQAQSKRTADRSTKVEIAVVEFTLGSNVSGMTAEAKRQLQATIAFELAETDRFDVYDVRQTRRATNTNLSAINQIGSTSAAVKAGKALGVSYVLTGMVTEYNTKGSATLNFRLVEVATGKVRSYGEAAQNSVESMNSGGAREMHSKVLRPAIARMTGKVTEAI